MVDAGVEQAIASAVASAVAMLLLALRRPGARIEPGSGERVLSYGRGLRAFAILGVGFAALSSTGALWGYFLMPDHAGWTPALVTLVVVLFWLIGGVLAIEVYGAWCRFTASSIARHSPWRGTLMIRWEEIESVGYEAAAGWYVLRTPRGNIHLEPYLDGIDEFLRYAHERLPPERWGAKTASP